MNSSLSGCDVLFKLPVEIRPINVGYRTLPGFSQARAERMSSDMRLTPAEALVEVKNGLGEDVRLSVTTAHMFGNPVVLLCGLMLMIEFGVPDETRAKQRHDGHRDDVRAEERNHHCERLCSLPEF
jgi:hypothetical protein